MPQVTKNRKKKKEWIRIYLNKTGIWNSFKHKRYFSNLKLLKFLSLLIHLFKKNVVHDVLNYAEISTD